MDLIPQLADSIDKSKLPNYINNDRYCFEQKIDGWRKLVYLRNGQVLGTNRQGKLADLPYEATAELPKVADPEGFILDCELVDDVLWVFDLPFAVGQVAPSDPYSWRRGVLDALAPTIESEHVRVLPSARSTADKLALSKTVILAAGEGLMVKDLNARYLSGKRHAGVLKAKFVKDVDCYITRFGVGLSSNGSGQPKSNVELAVKDENGKEVVIAECIIHPKERNVVDIGSVVTVNYLYCVDPAKPRLVQPTKLRPRDDKDADECLLDQLRYTDKSVHTWDGIRSNA